MKSVSTYLNFAGDCEEAMNRYAEIFGAEKADIMRYGDFGDGGGGPELTDDEKNKVMNTQITLPGGHVILGSDMMEKFGHIARNGNTMSICLDPDTREDADRQFAALADGGEVTTPLEEMFWGDYFGQLTDRFGIQWMINCSAK